MMRRQSRCTMKLLLNIAVVLSMIRGSMSGIKGLAPLLSKEAPKAIEEKTLESYQGQKIAIDASMAMYQFLIAVRAFDSKGVQATLHDSEGNDTSHLLGFFWRTIAMIKAGIKPVYVFDGKPPVLKSGEIANRNMRRAESERKMKEAEAEGDVDEMNKQSKRTLRVTREHADECKRLLTAMGVPIVDAPCEAEAQCAAMTRSGVVNAVATEDMDALCCGAKVLVRRLTMSEARKIKMPIQEFNLDKVLSGLNVTMDQFVDLCLLCGSDFCETIKGMGPQTALKQIKKHNNLAGVIASINGTKFTLPEYFPYAEAREILRNPQVDMDVTVNWNMKVDEESIVDFLVKEKGFSEQRVRNGVANLKKYRQNQPQGRLDTFFTKKPSVATLDGFVTRTPMGTASGQPATIGTEEVKPAIVLDWGTTSKKATKPKHQREETSVTSTSGDTPASIAQQKNETTAAATKAVAREIPKQTTTATSSGANPPEKEGEKLMGNTAKSSFPQTPSEDAVKAKRGRKRKAEDKSESTCGANQQTPKRAKDDKNPHNV